MLYQSIIQYNLDILIIIIIQMLRSNSSLIRTSNRIRSNLLLISNQENNLFMKLFMKINSITSQDYAKQFDSTINVTMIQTYTNSSSQGATIHKKKTDNILRIPTSSSLNKVGSSSLLEQSGKIRKKKLGKAKLKHSKTCAKQANRTETNIEEESNLNKSFESTVSDISFYSNYGTEHQHQDERKARAKEARHYLKNLLLSFKSINKSGKGSLRSRIAFTECYEPMTPNYQGKDCYPITFQIPLLSFNSSQLSKDDLLSSTSDSIQY